MDAKVWTSRISLRPVDSFLKVSKFTSQFCYNSVFSKSLGIFAVFCKGSPTSEWKMAFCRKLCCCQLCFFKGSGTHMFSFFLMCIRTFSRDKNDPQLFVKTLLDSFHGYLRGLKTYKKIPKQVHQILLLQVRKVVARICHLLKECYPPHFAGRSK